MKLLVLAISAAFFLTPTTSWASSHSIYQSLHCQKIGRHTIEAVVCELATKTQPVLMEIPEMMLSTRINTEGFISFTFGDAQNIHSSEQVGIIEYFANLATTRYPDADASVTAYYSNKWGYLQMELLTTSNTYRVRTWRTNSKTPNGEFFGPVNAVKGPLKIDKILVSFGN
ncbi:MAG: hypothetical protein JKY96_04860 [Phycisphaerales bacterium]|nr:hypothetical protein [Phycisphaerales bacterium]